MSVYRSCLAAALLAGLAFSARAQDAPNPPYLQARSKSIQILDGDDSLQGELVPELDPDIYVYHPTGRPKTVSFVTDLDRIDIQVEPGQSYDFTVLLDGQRCRQRFAPVGPSSARYHGPDADGDGDVLPFTLGDNNLIHVQGRFNGSPPLDLIFDTGASLCVLSEEGRDKGAQRRDGTDNRVEVAGVVVENTPVTLIDYRGTLKADGLLGYHGFLGKVVTIDYDNSRLVIHNRLPPLPDSYRMTPIVWRGAVSLIELTLDAGHSEQKVLALFDTGSRWSLSLRKSEPFVAAHFEDLPRLGSRSSRMASGQRVASRVVEIPTIRMAGLTLSKVQADLESPASAAGLPFNIAGNDLLKRFNAIIDYQRSEIYLQPNQLLTRPYNSPFDWRRVAWVGCGVTIAALCGWFLWRRRGRPQKQLPA